MTDYARNMAQALARIREIADFPNTPGGDMLPDLMGRLETIWKIANGETEQSSQVHCYNGEPCLTGGCTEPCKHVPMEGNGK